MDATITEKSVGYLSDEASNEKDYTGKNHKLDRAFGVKKSGQMLIGSQKSKKGDCRRLKLGHQSSLDIASISKQYMHNITHEASI